MTNKKFEKLVDKIGKCSSLEKRIEIINNSVKSLADLNDLLDSECFFNNEYIVYFNSLNNIQVIILSKYIEEYGLKREWHKYLYEYLNSFNSEEKITRIKEKIFFK